MIDKKERIVIAADKIFAKYGIKKTTMEDIAKSAGMGKATLYYYFKSKEEVFASVIKRDSSNFQLKLIEAINDADTPTEKLTNYVVARMEHLRELSIYFTTINDEYLEHYACVEKAREEFIAFEVKTLSNILKDGITEKVFTEMNVKITARNLSIALKGLEFPLIRQNSKANIKKESENMLTILFKGIEAR